MAQRSIPRPFNPFLPPELMNPQPIGAQPGMMQPPVPPTLASAPRKVPTTVEPMPQSFGASAAPAMPMPAPGQSGGGFMGGVNDFLGSDASLAFASGLLSGGPTGQAVGQGFANAFNARQKAAPATTDDLREYAFAKQQGYNGSFVDFMTSMKNAGSTKVNVGTGENEYDKKLGGMQAEEFNTLQVEGRKAGDALGSLAVMEQSMQDPNFYSGTGSGAVLTMRRAIASLGGDPNAAASMETFNAQAKQAALANMGGSLGTGFSNADRDFVLEQVPTLDSTPEGNYRLIQINKAVQQRKIEVAQLARDYASDNAGRIDQGFYDYLKQWAEQNPLFADQPRADPAGQSGGWTVTPVQ